MPASIATDRPRRTQAERRETTRNALLDATIDLLAAEGYAATTTRRVAELAGVTPGALQHHFGSKAGLVSEAMRRVMTRFAEEMLSTATRSRSTLRHHEDLLDRMWALHQGVLFQATMELLVAARTDEHLRKELRRAARDRAQLIAAGAPLLYPGLATDPGLIPLVMTGQATMRGLAVLAFAGEEHIDELWRASRGHLLQLIAELEGEQS
jgi:AcrR family transcriptional regulator